MSDYFLSALNAWLNKADHNYIEGRFLWLNNAYDGASILLWLASEQLMKILLMQYDKDLSNECDNLNISFNKLDEKGRTYNHKVENLIRNINGKYSSIGIYSFESELKELHKNFNRRYYKNECYEISYSFIHRIDELYFNMRSKIYKDIHASTIDDLYFECCMQIEIFPKYFEYLFKDNKFVKTRPHPKVNKLVDKEVWTYNGIEIKQFK